MKKVAVDGGWAVLEDKDEIEAKFRIMPQDIVKIRNKLAALDFKNCGEVSQEDLYFNVLIGYFDANIGYLRLRTENNRCVLTFKGLPIRKRGIKMRKEVEVELMSATEKDALEEILKELRMNPFKKIDKTREIWRRNDTKVFLDDVRGLGTFVEIELSGLSKNLEEIEAVKRELDLVQPVDESYLEMAR
jgi:predicted adenylyl cyclase CyaB